MNNYNFPVELQPVMTLNPTQGTDVIKGKMAVVRQDNGETLGIVSNKYGLLRHELVVNSFRSALQKENYKEKIELNSNGAYMFATYNLERIQGEVIKGDIVNLQFSVKNSYNGTNSMQIMLGAMRLVCSNGMVIGKEIFSFNIKHIGQTIIEGEIIEKNISMIKEQFNGALPIMKEMNAKNISSKQAEKGFAIRKDRLYLPKYILEAAKENYRKEDGETVWEYYNSLTAAITHGMKVNNPESKIAFGKVAWELAVNQL